VLTLAIRYRSAGDLARELAQYRAQGALLLPLREPLELAQYAPLALEVAVGEEQAELEAEVVQVLPGVGLVVRLREPELAAALAGDAAPAQSARPPAVELVEPIGEPELGGGASADEKDEETAKAPTLGPVSWTLEKLQAEWASLTMAERVRVAKYGKRPARGYIARLLDSTLHTVLLSNPGITAEEIAVLAGTASIDSAVLKRIISTPEWLRSTSVVRALICHPKATLPQVSKLVDHLPERELRQLTRTGKVRAAVKRIIIKKLELQAARGK
jgi:hypothetical protein